MNEPVATTPWLVNGPESKIRTVVRRQGQYELVVHVEVRPLVELVPMSESDFTDGHYLSDRPGKFSNLQTTATIFGMAVDLMLQRWRTLLENGRFILIEQVAA